MQGRPCDSRYGAECEYDYSVERALLDQAQISVLKLCGIAIWQACARKKGPQHCIEATILGASDFLRNSSSSASRRSL